MAARGLGYLPYFLTLKTLQKTVKAELWARNSYALGYLVPGRSDLDLTAWFDSEPSAELVRACSERLAQAKKLAPWIGEVNWYARPSAQPLARFMNPHERDRDPILDKRLGERERVEPGLMRARSAAFLMRMLEADARGVLEAPKKRLRKWAMHLQAVEAATRESAPDPWRQPDLLGAILSYAGRIAELPLPQLRPYIEGRARGEPLPTTSISGLWQASFPNRFCFTESKGRWERPASLLAVAQIEWEIWGIYSQFRAFRGPGEPQNTIEHLKRVGRMACRMLEPGVHSLRVESGLMELAGVIERNR